ncbi:ESCRT-II complex, vps25 subunit [Rozella allomycis CSF55]|uniref:ESCRT-II complex subunit VPS25 n=1 Tax=Rozella allomycis (strain CSF55) TaxID=988480 RepID=A0A4V1J084_ROZAC|nr:ESCRT-II complex, vps25 subunit [Rozella allomycis CSF55]
MEFPAIHSFPPFYTPQVHQETLKAQISQWYEIILTHCRAKSTFVINIQEELSSPLFNNRNIKRRLSIDFLREILNEQVKLERGEWETDEKNSCILYRRSLSELSLMIFNWVDSNGLRNSVFTVYELCHGNLTEVEEFHGVPTKSMKRALKILERQGKCQLIVGLNDDETGVKFS